MNQDLVHRMKSIRQTVQISSAQKLVAASHIAKAHKLLHDSEAYHNNVSRAIADILRNCPEVASHYMMQARGGNTRRGVLILSANKGLAGGFNSNVRHFAEQSLAEAPAEYIIVLGQARSQFIKKGYPVDSEYDQPLEPPTMFIARNIAEKLIGKLDNRLIDSFDVIYTEYISAVKLEVVRKPLFPVDPSLFTSGLDNAGHKGHYAFEPSPEHVLRFAVTKYLKGYIYGCLLHRWLCELTSRVTAMDNAIRNGNEMLDHLTLAYNRARQASITQEITEIVAGAATMATEE